MCAIPFVSALPNRPGIASLAFHFSLFTLYFAGNCAAAHEIEGPPELPEIVVTADPLGAVDPHLARPVQVLTGEELRSLDIRSIGETVSRELGVSASDFGTGVGRPVIRGLSGARVRVLDDGIGSMDVSTISPDHAVSAEPAFARQVEIFRGPATLLYGSGASGGLVNVVSDRILDYVPENLEGTLYAHHDSGSSGLLGGGSVNAGWNALALHMDGMIRETGDYDIPGFAELEPDQDARRGVLENSSVRTESFGGGVSFVGRRGFIGAAAARHRNDYGVPGHHHEDDEHDDGDDHEEEGGVRIRQDQTRLDVKGALNGPVSWLHEVRTRWGYNDYRHDELEPDGNIGTRFTNREIEGRVEFIHEPIADWNGVVGMQYRGKEFSAAGEEAFVPPADLDSVAVFLLEKRDFGRWHFDVGGRYEYQYAESSARGLSADHHAWSLSGGASLDFAEGWQLGASVTRAQRAPAIEELFSFGPHLATNTFEIGDSTLKKETATNVDVHIEMSAKRFGATANLFYNVIDDFVYLAESDLDRDGVPDRVAFDFSGDISELEDDEDELLLLFHRQRDAEFWGFELEGTVTLLQGRRGELKLRAWTDYVRGRLRGSGNVPRMTPWRFGAGLDYARGPWRAKLDYMRASRQSRTASLESPTAGYHMLDVYAGYTLNAGRYETTVFARGTNLLNEEARRHTSFLKELAPLPGRSGLIGLRVDF
jgi:iron complex outermembrane receptor protein